MSDAAKPRPRRSWLLIGSLCLNVALAAMIVVGVLRAMHPPGSPFGSRALIAAFPSDQGVLQKIADEHAAKLAALRQTALHVRHDALLVLAGPDYTPQKMATALAAVTAADHAFEIETIATMTESLSVLSPDERGKLAEHIRHRPWLARFLRPRPQ